MMIRFLVSVMVVLSVALAQGTKPDLTYTFTDKGVSGPDGHCGERIPELFIYQQQQTRGEFHAGKAASGHHP